MGKSHAIIEIGASLLLQSYASIVCKVNLNTGEVLLSNHWDYSRTTMKHLGRFLKSNAKEVRAKVKSGEYKIGITTDGRNL